MNRTDRLFAITVILQTRRRVRAQDLAALFEVSERTIYRDIVALSESGIPIIATPGEGYELDAGFRLPAIQLTSAEARAVFLAAEMLKAHVSGGLLADLESAISKVSAVLPAEARAEAARLVEIVRFVLPDGQIDLEDSRLTLLQQAIHEKRVVWLRYHSLAGEETTEREVEPETLHFSGSAWYVSGYCRLRKEPRSFRLSRVEDLRLRSETFLPRIMFPAPTSPVTVRVRFQPEVVRWVRERQHYGYRLEETQGDAVVMVYQVDHVREIRPWLLTWGAEAEVIEPQALRDSLREEIAILLERYST